MRVLDLFSGIGGFSLGLERAGMKTVAFCELEPFCRSVLRKHWSGVPIFNDVRELSSQHLTAAGIHVDLICGGFPCQPFSTASHGRRVAVDLWPEMFRLCDEIRPRYIIAENVQEDAIRRAASAIERLRGYRAIVRCVSADDAGADHTRDRWWVCAYPDDEGELHGALDAEVAELPELCRGVWGWENYARTIRVSDGLSDRVDRNRALGNAVLPFIPEAFGRAIMSSQAA